MTFSIVGRCPSTGMFGMAVSSSSPAVAARCAHVRSGIGVVGTQNFTDPSVGWRGLDLMQHGAQPAQAVAILASTAADADFRQLLAIGRTGPAAIHTGASCMAITAEALGTDAAAAGNLLASDGVPRAMVARFAGSDGHLAQRLVQALRAGLEAGGETEPVRSAGVVVSHGLPWPVTDLRVDWTEACPIADAA